MSHRPRLAVAAALAAALGVWTAAPAEDAEAPAAGRNDVELIYNGYFLGLRVMKAGVSANIHGGLFESTAVFRTAGLAGMFKEAQITASVHGTRAGGDFHPVHFEHTNSASKKNRRIQIDWKDDDVISTVTPPFGSMGQPPATPAQKLGARDVATTILEMTLYRGDAPCDRTLPIFDGKQRYDLRLEPVAHQVVDVRGYEGPAWRCNAYYVPVAGFDPEDMADPEDYARPMEIWLADLGQGRWPPVLIHGKVSGIVVRIEAKSVSVQPGSVEARVESHDPASSHGG